MLRSHQSLFCRSILSILVQRNSDIGRDCKLFCFLNVFLACRGGRLWGFGMWFVEHHGHLHILLNDNYHCEISLWSGRISDLWIVEITWIYIGEMFATFPVHQLVEDAMIWPRCIWTHFWNACLFSNHFSPLRKSQREREREWIFSNTSTCPLS